MTWKKRSKMDLWQAKPLGSLKAEWPEDRSHHEQEAITRSVITWTVICAVVWVIVALAWSWWFTPSIEQVFPGIKG